MNVVKDYCNLKLYMNTRFYANQNYKVDSIEDFLDTLDTPLTYNKLQYFKVLDVMKELKINCHQADIKELYKYNYARIEIVNDYSNTEWILYYFVTKINWISSSAVKLTLQLDTLNSFLDRMTFSNRTYIEREHQSRYKKFIAGQAYVSYDATTREENSPQYLLQRYIPFNISEELNPKLYPYRLSCTMKYADEAPSPFIGQTDIRWIKGYELKKDVLINLYGGNYFIGYGKKVVIGTPIANSNIYEFGDGKGTLEEMMSYQALKTCFDRHIGYASAVDDNADRFLRNFAQVVKQKVESDNVTLKFYYIPDGILPTMEFRENPGTETKDMVYAGQVNRTKTEILRASICPYYPFKHGAPAKSTAGSNINVSSGVLSILKKASETEIMESSENEYVYEDSDDGISDMMESEITITDTNNRGIDKIQRLLFEPISSADKTKCLEYYNNSHFLDESALYSSEFMDVTFLYGGTTYTIDLGMFGEDAKTERGDGHPFDITFSMSKVVTGAVTFKFINNYSIDANNYPEANNTNIMYNANNMDLQLINSEYLQYMRFGYNYDTKLNEITKQKEDLAFNKNMDSIMTSAISFNPLASVKAASKANLATIRYNQESYLNDLQRQTEMEKTLSIKKGAKVTTNDVSSILSLCTTYAILSYVVNAPSSNFREYYRKYFYLYGQKQQEYGIPTHNNRKIFDYLKCKADFVNRNNAPSLEILTDMIDKLGAGVTFIHKITDSTTPQWIFDFEDKENIEVDLFNYLSSN